MTTKEFEIPDKVSASFENNWLAVKGPKGEIKREFRSPNIKMAVDGKKIVIATSSSRRKDGAMLGTWCAHVKNMLISAEKHWEVKMHIVYSHFPIKLSFDDKNKNFVIQNFLGERATRYSKSKGDIKVDIKGGDIFVTGTNKEHVSQTAANLEQVTRIRRYDKRIFQDGCYIVQKAKPLE